MLKGRVKKLLPKFISPFQITQADSKTSNYCLELPNEMILRRIHNNFHSSRLRKYVPNDDEKFPSQDAGYFYDYGEPEDTEWFVDEIASHQWKGKSILFLVQWSTGESTWEPYENCKELQALDEYLALLGISDWKNLPKKNSESPARQR